MSKKFNHAILRIKNSEGRYDALSALRGQNSYELAVRYGFTGTEEEWMESMIGDGWIGAFQDLDDRFADLVAQVEAAHADGAIGTSQYADSSVTREKLANDALYSPVVTLNVDKLSHAISVSDVGKTIYTHSGTGYNYTVTLDAAADASIPVGAEIAICRFFGDSLTVTMNGVKVFHSEISNGNSNLSFTIPERYSMIALKKILRAGDTGYWLVTGNVEVVE